MNDDLVVFFAARLDEDERNAPMAGARAWRSGYSADRLLREVAAKRAILAEYQEAERAAQVSSNTHLPEPRSRIERAGYQQAAHGLRCAVQSLAAVYSDHPDYKPEWRPA